MTACPGCGQGIGEDAVRAASSFAVCPACGRVIDLLHPPPAADGAPPPVRAIPPPPDGVTLRRDGERVEIRIAWKNAESSETGWGVFGAAALFVLLFLLRPRAIPALFQEYPEDYSDRDFAGLQIFAAVLAAVFYLAWKYMDATVTVVVVEKGAIRSSTESRLGPPPIYVEAAGARQFYVSSAFMRVAFEDLPLYDRLLGGRPSKRPWKRALEVGMPRPEGHRFSVYGVFPDRGIVEIVPALWRAQDALFVEAVLESHFGIRDLRQEGELGPRHRAPGPPRPEA